MRAAMEKPRQVARKFLARPQHEGAGAVVRRSIGRYVGFPFRLQMIHKSLGSRQGCITPPMPWRGS